MRELKYDAAVVGAGAAGLAAALEIANSGFSVAIIEREAIAGGILNQCIHNGFGLHHFHEELTGPEYAERFVRMVEKSETVDLYTGTTALRIENTESCKAIYGFSAKTGITRYAVKAIVLATGCRERNRGNIMIPGTRPAGIFTAGLAQRLVNMEGFIPGRRVVIVGSGDIGLIMARRMRWVGAEVPAVVEIQPYPSGLTRNIVQCLNDFEIPLFLSHVISEVRGRDRVEAVEISPMDNGKRSAKGAFSVDCDTLLLSVGLIPDSELSRNLRIQLHHSTGGPIVDGRLMTTEDGVFACGNGLHVHDLVDYATEESIRCGRFVVEFLSFAATPRQVQVSTGANVRYIAPNRILVDRENKMYLRSLIVKNRARLTAKIGETLLYSKSIAHVQPSEMIDFTLDRAKTQGKLLPEGQQIEVSIQ